MKKRFPKPTDAEMNILRVLWQRGPSTVREVWEQVSKAQPTGYTTVLKFLQIMSEKGLVTRDDRERSHVYSAARSQEQTQQQALGHILERVFGGSTQKLVMQALASKKASRAELAEIRKLLDEMEGDASMNGMREFIGNPILQRIGWVLLHSLWQGALIAGGFEAIRFLLRRRSAQSRYVAGCCALTLLLMAPVVTFTLQRANHSPVAVGTAGSIGGTATVARSSADFATVTQTPASAFRDATALLNDIAPWLTAAWLAGVVLFAGRLTRSCWWVGKIRRRNQETVEQSLLDKLDALRRRLGISRPVRLLKSALGGSADGRWLVEARDPAPGVKLDGAFAATIGSHPGA